MVIQLLYIVLLFNYQQEGASLRRPKCSNKNIENNGKIQYLLSPTYSATTDDFIRTSDTTTKQNQSKITDLTELYATTEYVTSSHTSGEQTDTDQSEGFSNATTSIPYLLPSKPFTTTDNYVTPSQSAEGQSQHINASFSEDLSNVTISAIHSQLTEHFTTTTEEVVPPQGQNQPITTAQSEDLINATTPIPYVPSPKPFTATPNYSGPLENEGGYSQPINKDPSEDLNNGAISIPYLSPPKPFTTNTEYVNPSDNIEGQNQPLNTEQSGDLINGAISIHYLPPLDLSNGTITIHDVPPPKLFPINTNEFSPSQTTEVARQPTNKHKLQNLNSGTIFVLYLPGKGLNNRKIFNYYIPPPIFSAATTKYVIPSDIIDEQRQLVNTNQSEDSSNRTNSISSYYLLTPKPFPTTTDYVSSSDGEGQLINTNPAQLFTTTAKHPDHVSNSLGEQNKTVNVNQTAVLSSTLYNKVTYDNGIDNTTPSDDKTITEIQCGKETQLNCALNNNSEIIVQKWLGKIVANNFKNPEMFICSAILISEAYALVTNDCSIFLRIFRTEYYFSVRFGDYEIDRNILNKDCNITKDFGIEEVIPYREDAYNIALIRLRKNNASLVNISPICLFHQSNAILNLNENLFYPYLDVNSVIKQFSEFNNENIKNISSVYVRNAVTEILIPGDGIPLIYSYSGRWYLYGFSSQNGNASIISEYTRTSEYVDWIQRTVRPWYGEQCLTPNHNMGTCEPLRECPQLQEAFSNSLRSDESYLKQFVCQNSSYTFDVCCGSNDNFTVFNNKTNISKQSINKISSLKFCGLQHRDDYYSEDQNISIDEFPWIARIISPVNKLNLCSGSLINNRYVLSAASCNNISLLSSALVRLGEFNAKTDIDCVNLTAFGATDCSTVEDYGIEKVIIHPFFESVSHLNDIMLLRLDKGVIYTDYIRPICLPIPKLKPPKLGDTLYTTGFGFNSLSNGEETTLKKKLTVTLETNETCKGEFGSSTYSVNGELYTICTRSPINSLVTICFGDQGGPIMFVNRNRWHLEGLLSYVYCEYTPIQIHVRVSAYLEWIHLNLEP